MYDRTIAKTTFFAVIRQIFLRTLWTPLKTYYQTDILDHALCPGCSDHWPANTAHLIYECGGLARNVWNCTQEHYMCILGQGLYIRIIYLVSIHCFFYILYTSQYTVHIQSIQVQDQVSPVQVQVQVHIQSKSMSKSRLLLFKSIKCQQATGFCI